MVSGLQDALGISELSDAAVALIVAFGISLAVSTVIMSAMVVSVIGMIIEIIGAVGSCRCYGRDLQYRHRYRKKVR